MNEGKLYVKLYTMLKKINMDLGFCKKQNKTKQERKKRNRLLGKKRVSVVEEENSLISFLCAPLCRNGESKSDCCRHLHYFRTFVVAFTSLPCWQHLQKLSFFPFRFLLMQVLFFENPGKNTIATLFLKFLPSFHVFLSKKRPDFSPN